MSFKNKRKEIDSKAKDKGKKKPSLKDVSMSGMAEAEKDSSKTPVNLMLPRHLYYPDPQVRSKFDQHKINERAENMRKHGQFSPIKVHPADENGNYKIINGECRWRASEQLGSDFELWAVVDDQSSNWSEAKRIIVQVSDNVQQIELPEMDTARACLRLTELDYTSEQIAAEFSWYMKGDDKKPNRRKVGQFISLIKLPLDGQALVEDEVVTDLTTLEFLRKIYEVNEVKFQALISMIRENNGITRSRAEQEYKSCIANSDDLATKDIGNADNSLGSNNQQQVSEDATSNKSSDAGSNTTANSASNDQSSPTGKADPLANAQSTEAKPTPSHSNSAVGPTIRVEWNKSQEGVLVLSKAPEDAGCILVKLDNGDEINAQPHELDITDVQFA